MITLCLSANKLKYAQNQGALPRVCPLLLDYLACRNGRQSLKSSLNV